MSNCKNCNRSIKVIVKSGYVYCNKCLSYNVIVNGKAIKSIPKELR